MAFFKRIFSGGGSSSTPRVEAMREAREAAAEPVLEGAADDGEQLVELEVHGESHHQSELEAIAGPKDPDGKRTLVGVTLRCEPDNPYDENAIRVEVLGQLVGHIARDQAPILSLAVAHACGGVLEARGLVVGGWKVDDRDAQGRFATASEGHFGIRVWITARDAARLEIAPEKLDPSLRPRLVYPTLPQVDRGETRLSPTDADIAASRFGSTVTVVNEEHYQSVIATAMPDGWDDRSWPLLVDLGMVAANPHAKREAACVVVRIGNEPVGYFTPAMSQRHAPLIEAAVARGVRVTASASAYRGTKGGETFWRIKVQMQGPA